MLAHDLCSLIHQAFRVRHNRIAVQHTVQNLGILTILLRHGFVSTVTRGTVAEPNPQAFLKVPPNEQRLWADLKYRDDRAVLSTMMPISKPSKRVFMTRSELLRFCSGRRVGTTKPLEMGEIAVVHSRPGFKTVELAKEHEFVEAREALALGLEGEVLCRAG